VQGDASAGSLFQSSLTVEYLDNGLFQSQTQVSKSRGCPYQFSGNPPFTNLSYKGKLYALNAELSWSGLPGVTGDQRIAWLIVD
jgi:hypothetical protein